MPTNRLSATSARNWCKTSNSTGKAVNPRTRRCPFKKGRPRRIEHNLTKMPKMPILIDYYID